MMGGDQGRRPWRLRLRRRTSPERERLRAEQIAAARAGALEQAREQLREQLERPRDE